MKDEKGAYCGAFAKIREENTRFITPRKNETFSRVRMTFADCQEAAKEVMRVDS
jgi:hypothetical protein